MTLATQGILCFQQSDKSGMPQVNFVSKAAERHVNIDEHKGTPAMAGFPFDVPSESGPHEHSRLVVLGSHCNASFR